MNNRKLQQAYVKYLEIGAIIIWKHNEVIQFVDWIKANRPEEPEPQVIYDDYDDEYIIRQPRD
jgi:hypothetical protein